MPAQGAAFVCLYCVFVYRYVLQKLLGVLPLAEQLDHGVTSMRDVRISQKATFSIEYTVLGGEKMALLHTMAEKRMIRQELYQEFPYQTEKMELTLIPYHAWANRGITEMTTWLLDEMEA